MLRFRLLRFFLLIFGALSVVIILKNLFVLYTLTHNPGAVQAAKGVILVSTGFSLVCMAFCVVLITRLISDRLRRMVSAMQQVRDGGYPLLVVSGNDEISDLTRGFNQMVEELRTRDEKLKNWAGKRESDLATLSHTLEVERGKLETVLQSIGEGVIVLDNENRVLMANRRVAEIFGLPVETISGTDLGALIAHVHHRLVNPDVVDRQFQDLQRNTGSVDEIVLQLDEPHGPEIRLYCTPVRGANGRLFGRIATSLDLSRERELERLKTEFVSTISHELRTPLTSIKGALGLIRSGAAGPVSADLRELLDISLTNTERLVTTINDMLDMGQLEQGRMRMDVISMALPPLIHRAIEALNRQAQHRRVTIDAKVPTQLPAVFGDPRRVEQVLVNLLSNAVKFSYPDGRILVSAAANDGSAVISVRDFGVGMSKQFQERLFQKFEHQQEALTRDSQGAGLGLAICRQIVEALGGKIWAESEPGAGSTFSFSLPIAVQPLGNIRDEHVNPANARNRRLVLVVEDDEDAAKVISFVFESQGHRVITCHNGSEAMALTHRHRPDLLTLDLNIPGLNGVEVLQQLRADSETSHLPIICISAQPDPGLPGGQAGYFYMEKPVDIDKLRNLTEQAFAARVGGGAA